MNRKHTCRLLPALGALLLLTACQEEPPEPRYLGTAEEAASHDHAGHDHAGHDHAGHDHAAHDQAAQAANIPTAAPDVEAATGTEITVKGVTANLPEGWTQEEPTSAMRAAQFSAPGPGESDPAEIAVFYFGAQGAGDVESNIQRWIGQMQASGDTATRAHWKHEGLTFHTVNAEGEYNPGMAMASQGPQSGWTLFGAIVEGGPEGPIYIKMTGPSDVVDANTEAFTSFLASMR